ncbi:MAG: hypothetical protein LBL33_10535 [Tannerella sp.]|jgi:hypothetical protein|nr:hypothetical protein [Tannerella sp.]
MRKFLHLPVTIFILCTLYACSNREGVRVVNISVNNTKTISSVTWQEADSGRFYYDLWATESYYTFLDDKSDTVMRVYKKDEPGKIHNCHVRKERSILDSRPQFLKSNTRYPAENNRLWIVDSHISVKTLNPDNPAGQILSPPVSYPFRTLPHSTDYNLTKDEIYAAPLNEAYSSPYYFYRPDSGYFHVELYQRPGTDYPKAGLACLTCLTVSEENKSVVSAQRFMNDVLFYDLAGNIRTVASFGDGHTVPEIKDNTVDMDRSVKCFIYICGTRNRVYCLYDGTTDYTAKSKIVVFDWTGKHVTTYQTDRCLKQIAITSDDTRIVALAANEQHGGRDVVLYDIK